MKLDEIKKLIALGESNTLELKKTTANLHDAAKSLCGFLNAQGGKVIFGVTDQLKIVGQELSDKIKLEISNVLRKFEPSANIEVSYLPLKENKFLIIMTAHPDERSVPYTFDGRAYERGESNKDVMSQSRYHQLLIARNLKPISWESLPARSVTLSELDQEEISQTIAAGIKENHFDQSISNQSVEDILIKLGLIQNGGLINAAAVLFGKNIEYSYIQCVIRMARFKGTEKGDFIDNKQAFGNAFQLLNAAENFIRRNTAIFSTIPSGQMKRIDKPEYPVDAVREALINAICHRDYSSPGGAITITIYDDRLEIINTGLLPEGITLDELKKSHASHPRNPLITKIFYRRGLIEEMGMGTQKIIRLCKEAGMQEPEFLEQAGTFVVRLWSFQHKKQVQIASNALTERQTLILSVIGEARLAPNEIYKSLDGVIPERTLRRELNALKEQGKLGFEGGQGPNRKWYRID